MELGLGGLKWVIDLAQEKLPTTTTRASPHTSLKLSLELRLQSNPPPCYSIDYVIEGGNPTSAWVRGSGSGTVRGTGRAASPVPIGDPISNRRSSTTE